VIAKELLDSQYLPYRAAQLIIRIYIYVEVLNTHVLRNIREQNQNKRRQFLFRHCAN